MAKEESRTCKNVQDWEEKIIKIFPTAIPNECTWLDEIDILNVLFTLCSNKVANIFYPEGKKLGIYGVDFSTEDKCIELITENTIDIVSPLKLSFHYYEEALEWSYFRLETDDLKQISKTKNELHKEALISFDDGNYLDVMSGVEKYGDKDKLESLLIEDAKLVNRYIKKSSFLIFARSSYFKEFYDKSFNSFSDEELSEMIESLILNGNV
ncbi:hypothetical protein K0040_13015 [Terrisporobacter petrolearius]|uniref:hypothetical protein n=1 Tax=Terrisporobacter petrolearius TaxID=1460447 RepID=UPI001D1654D4|nr:hypothetical protein [Terrisporobacter petrolearius]MCC3865191.1 hypothetical protein [Terrisporobacter petrolearius]